MAPIAKCRLFTARSRRERSASHSSTSSGARAPAVEQSHRSGLSPEAVFDCGHYLRRPAPGGLRGRSRQVWGPVRSAVGDASEAISTSHVRPSDCPIGGSTSGIAVTSFARSRETGGTKPQRRRGEMSCATLLASVGNVSLGNANQGETGSVRTEVCRHDGAQLAELTGFPPASTREAASAHPAKHARRSSGDTTPQPASVTSRRPFSGCTGRLFNECPERLDLFPGGRHRLGHHQPRHALRTRRRGQRTPITPRRPPLRQERVRVHRPRDQRGGPRLRRQMTPDRRQGLVRRPLREKHADYGERTTGVGVDQVQLQRKVPTVHGVLAPVVEMKLGQLVARPVEDDAAPGLVVHLDGVAVVLDGDRARRVLEADLGQGSPFGARQIDRRLLPPIAANGEPGIQRTPAVGAELALISPARPSGGHDCVAVGMGHSSPVRSV